MNIVSERRDGTGSILGLKCRYQADLNENKGDFERGKEPDNLRYHTRVYLSLCVRNIM